MPSCGGLAPTAERTVDPAWMIVESLTSDPEIREQNLPETVLSNCSNGESEVGLLDHLIGACEKRWRHI